jgi:hypothetical protein
MVQKIVNKNVETKQGIYSAPDGIEIFHNNFQSLDTNMLGLVVGSFDNMQTTGQRIGDEVIYKGVSLRMMLELNERYSDVTFRILVVKAARGDTPTRETLFAGASGNKMIDTLNHERFTVIAQKYVKIKAPNPGSVGAVYPVPLVPPAHGAVWAGPDDMVLTRATKIVKIWIPGKKFGKGGKVTFLNGGTVPKFFDYHVLCYAYSNYTTDQDIFYVGRVNDYIRQQYYKDA